MRTSRLMGGFGALAISLSVATLGRAQQRGSENDLGPTERGGPESLASPPRYGTVDPQTGDDPKLGKHWLRTAAEQVLALGGGTAWYWIDRERQVADWDFPSLRERFTLNVMRYDNNPFNINYAWHAFNGGAFHLFGRINGLSIPEAVGAGFLASLTWEYALEFREKVSVNDLVFTTGAGLPLGEVAHVLGRYLHEDPDMQDAHVLRWTLGLPMGVTRLFNDQKGPNWDSSRHLWHRLALAYHGDYSDVTREGQKDSFGTDTLHLSARFVRMPGYLQRGAFSTPFSAANFSEGRVELSRGGGGDAMRVFADTLLVGHYQQDIHRSEVLADIRRAPERGFATHTLSHASAIGLAIGYRYHRETFGLWDDRVGALHMPGLGARGLVGVGDWSLSGQLRAHIDAVGINALANDAWNEANPNEQGKSILRKQGYYYGYGGSVAMNATLRYRRLALGVRALVARYASDEGLDRTQEDLTVDQKLSDTVYEGVAFARVDDLPWGLYTQLEFGKRVRRSSLERYLHVASRQRLGLSLGIER